MNHQNHTNIPDNLDQYIDSGVAKGKRNINRRFKRKLFTSIACALIISFVGSVNLSPSFADLMVQLPGMNYIIDFIKLDKGVQLAFEHDYYQTIEESATYDDVTVTIKNIVVDYDQLIVYYSVENLSDYNIAAPTHPVIYNNNNEPYAFSSSYGGNFEFTDEKIKYGEMNFYRNKESFPETVNLSMDLRRAHSYNMVINYDDDTKTFTEPKEDIIEDAFHFTFDIDQEKFSALEENIDINETVTIEGQDITFESLTIYPLRAALKIRMSEDNTKRILSFEELYLVDEKGSFAKIANGITASHIDDNELVLYFQSNYFNETSSLTLVGGKFSALDKDADYILFDPVSQELLFKPNDRISFVEDYHRNIGRKNGKFRETDYYFRVKYNDTGEEVTHLHGLFGNIIVDGVTYFGCGSSSSSDENGYVQNGFSVSEEENIPTDQPWKIMLNYYPEYIVSDFKITIK